MIQFLAAASQQRKLINEYYFPGGFTVYDGTSRNRVVRIKTDGSLDTSFNIGSGLNGTTHYALKQNDGKVICSGDFTSYNGNSRNRIVRLNYDGSLDTSFNIGTGFNNVVRATYISPDGSIFVGGSFTSYNGTSRNRIVKLNSDGSLDTSFNLSINNIPYAIARQPNGKIIVGGLQLTYGQRIFRINTDWTVDTSFDTVSGFNDLVHSIVVQPDGKILVGGFFVSYKGLTENRLIRLNEDGSKDTTFDIGTGFNDYVLNIALQPDGKILVSGNYTTYNGTSQNRLIRLNEDGSKDTTFDIGTGFSSLAPRSIKVDNDGKIICGGQFTSFNGVTCNRIARLNSDGSLDTSFNIGTGFDNLIYNVQN